MAVEIIKSNGIIKEIQGLAADNKPIDDTTGEVWFRIGAGSTFLELDTKKNWKYSLTNVNPLTLNGWWEQ